MKRILFSGTLLSLAVGCTPSENVVEQGRPNILLVVADDHGMDALGCYGNSVIKTPNLDALANEGVRFSDAYCTSASSAASRSVLLTGQYGHAIGAYGHVHDYHHFSTFDDVKSLPVLLADQGYATARIGKYHVAPESVYHFETTYEADPRNTMQMAQVSSAIFDSERPFFLYFCTDDPHRGDPFRPESWEMPNRFGNLDEGYEGVERVIYSPDEVVVPEFLPDTKQTREELAEYYESVSRIDQGFGRLIELLERSGKRENTVVIYISDNGMAFPGAKTTLYDPGMRLPCIISTPELTNRGGVNNAMITWADITPTILELAGAGYDAATFHGRSFAGEIDTQQSEGFDEIFAAHNFHEITMYYPMRVLRDRRYKLIWNVAWQQEYPFASDLWDASTWQRAYRDGEKNFGKRSMEAFLQRPRFELYDIENDPDEVVNLADSPQYHEVMESMKLRLRERMVATRDPWIVCWGDHDNSLQGTGVNL